MGYHFLLQGIFPTQGSNPGLLHCRHILYQLSQMGSPVSAIHQCKSVIIIYVYIYEYIHTYIPLHPHSSPLHYHSVSGLPFFAVAAASCYLSILHMTVHMCQYYFLSLSHPLLPLCPPVHSLCPCLHLFSVNRFISTIFLDCIYMC